MREGMLNHKFLVLLQLVVAMLLFFEENTVATLQCPDCGKTKVPFPLSTTRSCGDPSYKVRCTAGKLLFGTINGSSYIITSISPENRRLVIGSNGFIKNSCIAADIQSQGVWLNESLPFMITNKNTILKFNCTESYLKVTASDCSSGNPCYKYFNNSKDLSKCRDSPCCSYTTGGSKTAYRIVVKDKSRGCAAYLSFVNLKESSPVTKWPKIGLQIKWKKPDEPVCKVPADCQGLANSSCLPDRAIAGQKRCFCNKGLQWDPINGICDIKKCQAKEHCPHHINHKKLYQGLIFAASGIVIIVIFIVLLKYHQKQIKREAHRILVKQREDILNSNTYGKAAKLFSGKEMKRSTNNFSKENLLGVGGFGEVYKGKLEDGSLAAIKKAKNNGNTLGMDQILNEVCVLCQVNHRSLVQLLGCCLDLDQPVLVYEYIPNGTLFEHLHGHYANEMGTLTWKRRLLIAKQTAEGLAYLHFSAVPSIFHRDIKSSNVLLDEKFDAKVADFGLSRLVDTEGTHISTCAQGTLGYLDPEYYHSFQLTDRSDVYSFGVVLLELLTSKKAIDFKRDDEVNLAIYVSKLANNQRLLDAVDPGLTMLASNLELETMKAFGLLALACVDEQRKNRPSMREVTEELEYIISIIAEDSRTLL